MTNMRYEGILKPICHSIIPSRVRWWVYLLRHPDHRLRQRLNSICRLSIETFLDILARDFPIRGRILEVGAGERTANQRRFSHGQTSYIRSDLKVTNGENMTIGCNCIAMPFHSASLDAIICSEVLEHVPDFGNALKEFARTLRPGGHLVLTVPFFYQYHGNTEESGDYWRYTSPALKHLLNEDFILLQEAAGHLFHEKDDFIVNVQMLWQRKSEN